MFSGRRAGAARRASRNREATNTSVDHMGSQEVEDEVFFQDERDSAEEEERQDEVVPWPSTPNPVYGMNQRSAEAEDGLLDDEEDEEIELGERARAALVEPKARHDLFEKANPADAMLAFFAAKREGRQIATDNIIQVINAMDLGKLAPDAVRNLSTRPRSISLYVVARMKADAGFKIAAEDVIATAADASVTGPNLALKLEGFLCEMGSALRAHTYLSVMCLVELISRVRGRKNEGKEGFVRSGQVESYCTQWCLTPARRLKLFLANASAGELSTLSGSVAGSFGLQRLSNNNSLLEEDLLYFVNGLISYLSYEVVTSASAEEAVAAIVVEESDFTHSLRMKEEDNFGAFKAKLKSRMDHAKDACVLHNQEWRFPCGEKMCLTLKHCCSVKLWTKCMAIMDMDSVEYEDLNATEATELFERAQERIDVYSKNKKVLPPKKQTRQPEVPKQQHAARQAGAAGEQAQAQNGGGGNRPAFKDLMPGSIKRDCKFNKDGKCHLGIMCPYRHVGMEVQQEEAAVKKQIEVKVVAAQAKAAAPPATGRGGIQIPSPRYPNGVPTEKVIAMICKEETTDDSSSDSMTTSSEPEDQQEWEWRISKGELGLPPDERRTGKRTVVKTADGSKYSDGGFAVLGDEVDWKKLAEHGAEMVMDSSGGSGMSIDSVDLGSEDLSDDEEVTEARSKKVQAQMVAAAGREDYVKAGELKLELTRLRKGLAKAAADRGASETDCNLLKQRAVSKQKSIMQMAKIVVNLTAVSAEGRVMLQDGFKGLRIPKVPARSVLNADSEWRKLAAEMEDWLQKLGAKVTRMRKLNLDGKIHVVADVDSEFEVDGMVWVRPSDNVLSLHSDDRELLKEAELIGGTDLAYYGVDEVMTVNELATSEVEAEEMLKQAMDSLEAAEPEGADDMLKQALDAVEMTGPEQIFAATGVCLHSEMLCPKGFAVVDQVDNAWCGVCKAKVNMDVAHCCEVCGCQNAKSDSSSEDMDFREAL